MLSGHGTAVLTMLRSVARRSSCPSALTLAAGFCVAALLADPSEASAAASTSAHTATPTDEASATNTATDSLGSSSMPDALSLVDTRLDSEEPELGYGITDPRKRRPPRTHRFRLAFQLDHVRLSAAVDDEGMTQRFHYLPLQLDFAYQVQLFRVLMVRPSFAIGANPANTTEAMPALIHPQIFAGYQGKGVGLALGYGYAHPMPARKDVISETRGGLGQPVITKNHLVRGELSYTTRVDRGALTFALRMGGIKSHIRHYDLDERGWRFSWGVQIGWFFGDGTKSEERQAERRRARRERKKR